MILPELIPMNIDIGIGWIVFFYVPPGPMVFEDIFDKTAVISLAYVQGVGLSKLLRDDF